MTPNPLSKPAELPPESIMDKFYEYYQPEKKNDEIHGALLEGIQWLWRTLLESSVNEPFYRGRGNHSVNQLEAMVEAQKEKLIIKSVCASHYKNERDIHFKKTEDFVKQAKEKIEQLSSQLSAAEKEIAELAEANRGMFYALNERDRLEKQIESYKEEVECLRSVLSEWDQDKSCYVQMNRANEIAASRTSAGVGGRARTSWKDELLLRALEILEHIANYPEGDKYWKESAHLNMKIKAGGFLNKVKSELAELGEG